VGNRKGCGKVKCSICPEKWVFFFPAEIPEKLTGFLWHISKKAIQGSPFFGVRELAGDI
jgi:hypothetical protein